MKIISFLALVLTLISCSKNKEFFDQEIRIKVSPKVTSFFAETDLSSNFPFPIAVFLKNQDVMLGFNIFNKSIDTLFFEGDQLKVKAGNYLQSDGPRKVENFVNMCHTPKGMVYISQKVLVLDNEETGEIENFKLLSFDKFWMDMNYNIELGASFSLDHFYRGYDIKNDKFYFFVKNAADLSFGLYEFDLVNNKTIELIPHYNSSLIEANNVTFSDGKFSVSKNNMPYIYFNEEKLIISYQYSNELVVIDLTSGVHRDVFSETFLFPNSKMPPSSIPSDLDHMEALDKLNEWDFDVAYGNLEKLPNEKGFCRIVRGSTLGEDKKNPEIFMEVFDLDLKKIGEKNLTAIQPDLSTFFFAVGDRLFFKAKEQSNENYLNYYFVEIDF
jgi:hypothetical protein